MKEYSRNTQMAINLVSGITVFIVNMLISFFLSPYIVENIGVEANGFVTLANNFINYATLLVTVINSMAGRFITIEIHRENVKKANVYYTSVFYANLVLLLLFLIPSIFLIISLEKIIDIPLHMVVDVKILFSFIFCNFLAGLAIPMWGTATYITNRLYITSLGTMLSNIIRFVSISGMFAFFEPKVWYIGFASFLVMAFSKIWNYCYKKRLTPELRISKKSFSMKAIAELITSGVWNAISSLGSMLLSGLDLLIANIFIGSTGMGILSVAKIIPHFISNFSSAICNVFAPELTINYAKGEKERIKKDLKQAMNITGIFLTIPLAILFVFGDSFYDLWVPSQNSEQLQILSALTVIGYIFTSGTQVLYNVFVTVNKVRNNSLLLIISGVVSTVIVFLALNITEWGIYAVAGVSSVVNIVRNMCYTVPFAAKYIGFKWYTFFSQVGKSIISVLIMVLLGYCVKTILCPSGWFTLVLSCGITAIIGFLINIFVVLSSEERKFVVGLLSSKIRRKGGFK